MKIINKLGFWTKTWNRTDYASRCFFVMLLGISISLSGLALDSLKTSKVQEMREKWVKKEVRDPKADYFKILDEEDPPVPLKEKTPVEQFREEFAKFRDQRESMSR